MLSTQRQSSTPIDRLIICPGETTNGVPDCERENQNHRKLNQASKQKLKGIAYAVESVDRKNNFRSDTKSGFLYCQKRALSIPAVSIIFFDVIRRSTQSLFLPTQQPVGLLSVEHVFRDPSHLSSHHETHTPTLQQSATAPAALLVYGDLGFILFDEGL